MFLWTNMENVPLHYPQYPFLSGALLLLSEASQHKSLFLANIPSVDLVAFAFIYLQCKERKSYQYTIKIILLNYLPYTSQFFSYILKYNLLVKWKEWFIKLLAKNGDLDRLIWVYIVCSIVLSVYLE